MPKIVINEIDLTTASYQPAVTDVAFVPGLSEKPLEDTDNDMVLLCNTISQFEDNFGSSPAILYDDCTIDAVFRNDSRANIDFDPDQYISYFKSNNMPYLGNVITYRNGLWIIGKKSLTISQLSGFLGIDISGSDKYNSVEPGTDYEPNTFYTIDTSSSPYVYELVTSQSAPENWPDGYYYKTNEINFVNGDTITANIEYDKSYIYAKELLRMGIPVVYNAINVGHLGSASYESIREHLSTYVFDLSNTDGILDKGEYSIKYLTSGAYPSFEFTYNSGDSSYGFSGFAQKMLDVAATRGDCVAIIDSTRDLCGGYTYNSLIGQGSLWDAAKAFCDSATNLEYGTMFTPYGVYNTGATYTYAGGLGTKVNIFNQNSSLQMVMPASFGYLLALGESIRTNANWYAVAGTTRGQVPLLTKLDTKIRLSNTMADMMQSRYDKTSINAITNIKPYGLTIWGNRTLHNNEDTANGGTDGLVATSFLNIRNLVSDVKKVVYNAAKILMFEQNTDILWINFVSKITPTLDSMRTGRGLSNYKIIKQPTSEKAKLKAVIKLYPIYAVEDFEVTIELSDEDVNVQ